MTFWPVIAYTHRLASFVSLVRRKHPADYAYGDPSVDLTAENRKTTEGSQVRCLFIVRPSRGSTLNIKQE